MCLLEIKFKIYDFKEYFNIFIRFINWGWIVRWRLNRLGKYFDELKYRGGLWRVGKFEF